MTRGAFRAGSPSGGVGRCEFTGAFAEPDDSVKPGSKGQALLRETSGPSRSTEPAPYPLQKRMGGFRRHGAPMVSAGVSCRLRDISVIIYPTAALTFGPQPCCLEREGLAGSCDRERGFEAWAQSVNIGSRFWA